MGGAQRPPFLDIDVTYPSLRVLDRNFPVIREELMTVLEDQERIPRYHEISRAETYISGTVDPTRSWRVFMLAHVSGAIPTNQARCPRTSALRQHSACHSLGMGALPDHALRAACDPASCGKPE